MTKLLGYLACLALTGSFSAAFETHLSPTVTTDEQEKLTGKSEPAEPATISILVAAHGIRTGEALNWANVAKLDLQRRFVTQNMIRSYEFEKALGRKLVIRLSRGDPVLWTMLEGGDKDLLEVQKRDELAKKQITVIVASSDLKEGTVLTFESLAKFVIEAESFSSEMALAVEFDEVVSRKLRNPLKRGDVIRWENLSQISR